MDSAFLEICNAKGVLMENLTKIKNFYETNIYGRWRSGEYVTYKINKVSKRHEDMSNPFAAMFKLSTTDDGTDVEIHVEKGDRKASFAVRVYVPGTGVPKPVDGWPILVCMHPVAPKEYALKNGYAVVFMDTSMLAEDNNLRRGAFYDLYPYTADPATQTGELMAWGWGAAKVLDAI